MAFCFQRQNHHELKGTYILSFFLHIPHDQRTTRDSLLPYMPLIELNHHFVYIDERWGNNLHTTLDISVVDVGREAHILGVGVDLLS
jgi:hypothetical protein